MVPYPANHAPLDTRPDCRPARPARALAAPSCPGGSHDLPGPLPLSSPPPAAASNGSTDPRRRPISLSQCGYVIAAAPVGGVRCRRGVAMRRRISSAKSGTPARPRRVARSRGVSGGLRLSAACSRMTCSRVGGLRSSWSSRKSSGWTASRPSGLECGGWEVLRVRGDDALRAAPESPLRPRAGRPASGSQFAARVLPSR